MTNKQKRFCEEYLIDLNATQAAIRAGYSPRSANKIAAENMAKPGIRACIDKEMAERSKRTGVNADRVIRELARVAFVNAPLGCNRFRQGSFIGWRDAGRHCCHFGRKSEMHRYRHRADDRARNKAGG